VTQGLSNAYPDRVLTSPSPTYSLEVVLQPMTWRAGP